jgi:RNA polymerase sigma-70 factor (ECF subfamily)
VIRAAAEGDRPAREEFVRRYEKVVRACLGARWKASPLLQELEDAAQEVFLECFRPDGPLRRADPARDGGFRAFLGGVVRNVARRCEERRGRADRQPGSGLDLADLPAREESMSRALDRSWARALIREATARHAERAREKGEAALRRVELLRLRFGEGLAIRDIALRLGADPARLHHDYAAARDEFAAALREVVREHGEGTPADIDAECARLAQYLRA